MGMLSQPDLHTLFSLSLNSIQVKAQELLVAVFSNASVEVLRVEIY